MLLKKFIDNYYWVIVLLGAFGFFGGKLLGGISMLLIGLTTVYSYAQKPFRFNAFDVIIVFFIIYQLVSCEFSSYPRVLYIAGIKAQIVPILFYFLGRNMMFADNKLLENMKTPMMIAFIGGIFFFFWAPSWYTAMKIAREADEVASSTELYYGWNRLGLMFKGYYDAGYGAVIFLMFYIKRFLGKEKGLYSYFCVAVALICMFFSQLRVCIAFFGVYLVILTIFSQGGERKTLFYIWLFVAIGLFGTLIYIFNYAEDYLVDFINRRFFENEDNIVEDRFDMFARFCRTPLWGDGLGRYGHAAVFLTHTVSCTDNEYLRVMNELGIVGWIIFGIFYLKIMIKSFFNIKYFLFEFSMFAFFLAAMIGATPLENGSMQPFIFWYCAGRVANPVLLKRLKYQEETKN